MNILKDEYIFPDDFIEVSLSYCKLTGCWFGILDRGYRFNPTSPWLRWNKNKQTFYNRDQKIGQDIQFRRGEKIYILKKEYILIPLMEIL